MCDSEQVRLMIFCQFSLEPLQPPPARPDLKRPEQVASETGPERRDVSSQKIRFEMILSFFGTSQHLKTQAVLSVLKIWPILIFLKSS